jgi:hypothetical protein
MNVHLLKSWTTWYPELVRTDKPRRRWEIREDDRDFQEGDELEIREFDPETHTFTGRSARFEIELVHTDTFLKLGYVVLQLSTPRFIQS